MKYLKTFEGRKFKAVKKGFSKSNKDINAIKNELKNIIKSTGCETKQVGNDLEVYCGEKHLANIIFRKDYIGIKSTGAKFTDEFKYDEFGKIKQKVSEITKK